MMKKIIKILLTLICIGIFAYITLSGYVDEKTDVSRRVGNKINGGTMSTTEYAAVSEAYGIYMDYLKSGDYATAYSFLSYEYKQYKTIEEFLNEIKEIKIDNVEVKEIRKMTDKLYSVIIDDGDGEKENMVIFNSDSIRFFVVPDTFIEHKVVNGKLKKKNVQYEVIDTINYIDKFVVNMKITNISKKDSAYISKIELKNDGKKETDGSLIGFKLAPLESKEVTVEFETYIEFPNQIKISRTIKENDLVETYFIDI